MKKLFIISILISGLSSIIFGQSKDDDLKRLFVVMQSEKMIDKIMDNMLVPLMRQAENQISKDEDKKVYNDYMEFVIEETKELSKKLVNVEMVEIYDKHFTHDEIKDLIVFYESPTGKKILEKTPEITKDLMEAMMNDYMPEFQEKLMKELERLK